MESLSTPHVVKENRNLLIEINRMQSLTEVHMDQVDLHVPGIHEALFGLTNLKSLGFCRDRHRRWRRPVYLSPDSTRRLTGLTKLVDFSCSVASIRHLTNLAILRFNICYDSAAHERLSLNLKLLEELDVSYHFGFRGKIFSDLPRLKRLCIRDNSSEDGDFFTTLGRLPQLSRFSFIRRSVEELPLDYCLQFNLISGLRSLSICLTSKDLASVPDPCDFLLEGSFPLLRSLHLEGFALSQTQDNELMRRFPCLNALSGVERA